jgi:hypothetical protein
MDVEYSQIELNKIKMSIIEEEFNYIKNYLELEYMINTKL